MSESPKTTIHVVCTGSVGLRGGKHGVGFRRTDGAILGEALAFDRKSKVFGRANVGSVYSLEMSPSDDGDTFHAPIHYERAWGDPEQVLEWKVVSDLVDTQIREAKTQKAGEKATLDRALATLDPIRKIYHSTDTLGRRIVLAQVMEYLNRNPRYDG